MDQSDLNEGRDPARYAEVVRRFLSDARDAGQPFFLMANAHDPHRPFHGSDQEAERWEPEVLEGIPEPTHVFEAGDWPVPGFLPDVPETRQEVAEYLSSSRRADDVFAAVLAELDAVGATGNTLVIFLSDNGMAFPFAKTNCYLHSTKTPWIVRWPGRVPTDVVDDTHFVEGIDITPTILEAVGLHVPPGVDGRSHLTVLEGGAQADRDRIVTVFHENAFAAAARRRGEDPSPGQFEMRCVQDARWGYIWNAWSDGEKPFFNESQSGRTWEAMRAAARNDAFIAGRADFFEYRVPEELYDFGADPDALVNLVDDESVADVLAELRGHLRTWMRETDDHLLGRYESEILTSGG